MLLTKLPETPTATAYAKWDAGTSQLSNRVAKALEDEGTKADALDALANECRMRDAEARRLSIVRDELVLEPGTSPANSERLWKELESLGVARRRLARAAEKLEARKVEVVEADREKGRRERYDAALRFRDETAAMLRKEYPEAVRRITELLAKLEACERTVVLANQDRPRPFRHLHVASC